MFLIELEENRTSFYCAFDTQKDPKKNIKLFFFLLFFDADESDRLFSKAFPLCIFYISNNNKL